MKEFYILANKFEERLGFYLIRFAEKDVNNYKFMIKHKNKLDIGDAIIAINNRSAMSRELVVAYKTIYINTYTIMVLDITTDADRTLLFRHESF